MDPYASSEREKDTCKKEHLRDRGSARHSPRCSQSASRLPSEAGISSSLQTWKLRSQEMKSSSPGVWSECWSWAVGLFSLHTPTWIRAARLRPSPTTAPAPGNHTWRLLLNCSQIGIPGETRRIQGEGRGGKRGEEAGELERGDAENLRHSNVEGFVRWPSCSGSQGENKFSPCKEIFSRKKWAPWTALFSPED